ncbi:MAG: hypothetical protein GF390_02945 [Candidatus Pacebacteria bacterium]|nr:hypothetical protein [Candidatus Paceibacterota bacterium]
MLVQKPKALIFTTIQGHQSIAQAINEHLINQGFITQLCSKTHTLMPIYQKIYIYVPKVFKIIFDLSNIKSLEKLGREVLKKDYLTVIQQQVNQFEPHLILNTNFAFNSAITTVAQNQNIPFINITANPRTFSNFEISNSATTNCVFDQTMQNLVKKTKPQAHTTITGWFVRKQFEQAYQFKKIRQKLNLDPQKLTLLFVTGSEGTQAVLKTLKPLAQLHQPVQILVACGKNQRLLTQVQQLKKHLNEQNKLTTDSNLTQSRAVITPFAFTKKLHLYMQAADLVIGKAGPNTLFESVATLTPFFASTHVAGQEDGNLKIIQDYNLGYVEENPLRSVRLLKKIIADPQQLQEFQSSLKKMAQYNCQAKSKLLQVIKNAL